MPILVKKDKKKINYFFYISLLAFILVIAWLLYSKWASQKKVAMEKSKEEISFDVTKGLADVKLEETQRIMENDVYREIKQFSNFIIPQSAGKDNPFSKDW